MLQLDEAPQVQVIAQRPRARLGWGGEWAILLAVAGIVAGISWNALAAAQPGHTLASLSYAGSRLRLGQMPLWNPYVGLGQPLLGNGHVTIFYPAIALFMYLPAGIAWRLCALIHLALAGGGAWLLARRIGMSAWPRLTAAIAFMLGGLLATNVNSPEALTMALLPWGVLALDRLIEKRTLVRATIVALAIALMLLAGDASASFAAIAFLLLVLALSFFTAPNGALRATPMFIAALALGIGVAGAQCLPMQSVAAESLPPAAGILAWPQGIPIVAMTSLFLALAGIFLRAMSFGAPGAEDPHPNPPPEYQGREKSGEGDGRGIYVGKSRRPRRVNRWIALAILTALLALLAPLFAHRLKVIGIVELHSAPLRAACALAVAILAGAGLQMLAGAPVEGIAILSPSSGTPGEGKMPEEARGGGAATLLGRPAIFGALGLAVAIALAAALKTPAALPRWLWPGIILPVTALLVLGFLKWRVTAGPAWVALLLAEMAAVCLPIAHQSAVASGDHLSPLALARLRDRRIASPGQPFRFDAPLNLLSTTAAQGAAQRAGACDLSAIAAMPSWRELPLLTENHQAVDPVWFNLLGVKYQLAGSGGASASATQPAAENREAFPRAWTVRRAQWFPTAADAARELRGVLQSEAEQKPTAHAPGRFTRPPRLDPRQLVYLDRQLSGTAEDWVENAARLNGPEIRLESWASPLPAQAFVDADDKPASVEPEQVRIAVGGAAGWVVIASSYDPGWVAHVDTKVPGMTPLPRIVLPADGFLQAVPLRETIGNKAQLVLDYQPIAFRWGVYLTCGSALLWLILLACGLMHEKLKNNFAGE